MEMFLYFPSQIASRAVRILLSGEPSCSGIRTFNSCSADRFSSHCAEGMFSLGGADRAVLCVWIGVPSRELLHRHSRSCRSERFGAICG